jgi:hypothetical protein
VDNNGKSRITSALTHFFSLLVIDSVGYIVARTVVHTKVFRSQVGHRNRYTFLLVSRPYARTTNLLITGKDRYRSTKLHRVVPTKPGLRRSSSRFGPPSKIINISTILSYQRFTVVTRIA